MMQLRARAALFALIFLCLATILVVSIQKITEQERAWSVTLLERNPQFLHCERMQGAVARAAADALALRTAPADAALQADLLQQRRQIQADWMGMEQLAAHDPQRQGLLLEIRASLADFFIALDQTAALPVSALASGLHSTPGLSSTNDATHLMLALQRVQRALSNDAGSLEQNAARTTATSATTWVRSAWISLLLLFLCCGAFFAQRM